MIDLFLEGGLCNRMRAIASAVVMAKRLSIPLRVHWFAVSDLNCRYERLFETSQLPFELIERDASAWRRYPVLVSQRIAEMVDRASGRLVLASIPTHELAGRDEVYPLVAARKHASIRTYSRLIPGREGLEIFAPRGDVARAIHDLRPRVRERVGVHIRRGDNVHSIRASPLAAFLELMDREVAASSSAEFFVSTDAPEVMRQLLARYGSRVLAHEKRALDRNDPIAIEDAVIDLFSLGNCTRLIGSRHSSFTDIAADLNAIPVVLA